MQTTDEQSPRACLRAVRFGRGQKPARTAPNSLLEADEQDSSAQLLRTRVTSSQSRQPAGSVMVSCEVPAGFVMILCEVPACCVIVLRPHSPHLHLPVTRNKGSRQSRVPAAALPFHAKVFTPLGVTKQHTHPKSHPKPPSAAPKGGTQRGAPPAPPPLAPSPEDPNPTRRNPFFKVGSRALKQGDPRGAAPPCPAAHRRGSGALPGDPPQLRAPPPFRGQDPCGDGGSPASPPEGRALA